MHADKRDEPTLYVRRLRELIGHGECVMGILDSYPHPWPTLPPEACEALECALVRWRWRLRNRAHRLSRTHGDFHPWNLLFREGTDFSVLDRSRGEWGEPADDVAALGINYLFFGMRKAARHGQRGVAEPFATLFGDFLTTYIEASRDHDILRRAAAIPRLPRARARAPPLVSRPARPSCASTSSIWRHRWRRAADSIWPTSSRLCGAAR